ncbi:Trafficking protein particle complex subunit 10 [Tyrophagus putrescentiae]|nr:Trafficking protein particle complex subunit 10 [Tyrophagus putrescentiae]
MGTYKHIGYIRSARLIGAQLARLYLQLGRPQQALPFLHDHYNLFTAERWSALKAETARLLARCLEALYYSAYKGGGGKSNGKDEKEEENDAQPAFNLEATARSAFRTYLLLLLKPTALAQKQICAGLGSSKQMTSLGRSSKFSTVAADVSHQQQQQQLLYLSCLKKLLLTYTKNGLLLREIVEKLVHSSEQSKQSSLGLHQEGHQGGGDGHQKTTTAVNLSSAVSGRQQGHSSSSHYLE